MLQNISPAKKNFINFILSILLQIYQVLIFSYNFYP
jgi:hypothetical protein